MRLVTSTRSSYVVTAQNPKSSGSSSRGSSIGGCQVIVPRSRRRANVFSRSSPVVDQNAREETSSASYGRSGFPLAVRVACWVIWTTSSSYW